MAAIDARTSAVKRVPRGTVDREVAEAFFSRQFEDPANRTCCDGGAGTPEWTSVSHGIYISIGSAGVHRSLGVGVSFVQHSSMDSWKPVHLKMMELGGNQRFADFLRQHRVPEDMPIRQKYRTRAAQWYRENLRAMTEGWAPPPPLAPGEGCLPVDDKLDRNDEDEVLDEVFAYASDDDGVEGSAVHRQGRLVGRGRPFADGEECGGCYAKACKSLRSALCAAKTLAAAASAKQLVKQDSTSPLSGGRHKGAVAGVLRLGALAAA